MNVLPLAVLLLAGSAAAVADNEVWLPTGQTITPLAAPGSTFSPLDVKLPVIGHAVAGQPVTTAVSPDGKTLFVLTSGYNVWRDPQGKIIPEASTEHLFVYDISAQAPVQLHA